MYLYMDRELVFYLYELHTVRRGTAGVAWGDGDGGSVSRTLAIRGDPSPSRPGTKYPMLGNP